MLLLAALSIGLALSAEVTPAAAPAPAAVPSATAAPASFEQKQKVKLKCEKLVELGSRMPKRVCRTPEQIKQVEEDARETTREFQKINPEQYH
jgi:TolA-binding protein